jgi:WS/DGAT C-terminal domain
VVDSAIARSVVASRLFNVTITSVYGPKRFGSPIVDVILVVPIAADDVIGLAIFVYDGGVTVGLCADRASVPDLDVLADGFRDAVIRPDHRRHGRGLSPRFCVGVSRQLCSLRWALGTGRWTGPSRSSDK